MRDPARITLVGDHSGELIGDTQPALRLRQQHDAAVGTDPPAVEGGGNLLAVDDGKTERQKVIVGHGGCGARDPGKGWLWQSNPMLDQKLTPLPPPLIRLRNE